MATNYIQPGEVVTVPAPTGGVTSGELVVIGSLAGVATETAAQTVDVALATTGVFTLTKVEAQAWTAGLPVYWDPDPGIVTSVAAEGNVLVGVAMEVAANPSTTGVVRLNGSFRPAEPAA